VATFRFVGRDINIHWNGYDIKGPAGTVFSIPDQLYEEFEGDLRGAEPSLEWIDTNEFLTLTNAVSVTTLEGNFPISVTSTTSGKIVGVTSSTASDGFVLTANGSGGVAWEALPGDATGITNIIGTSPISAAVSGTSATISLTANYQTAGTYVTGVSGNAPITASGTTSITVGIDQTSLSAASALNAEVLRHNVKNTTGTTIQKGSAVYVSGATGDNALISLASASSEVTSSKTLGITAESIANDAFGYVIEAGYLTGIDTSSTTAGAAVWLGNTPGSLVFVSPPAEPSHSVYLGVVARVQQNNGSILVKVQNGYELDELHDVFVGGVSTALPLVYSSTSSGWVAQALSSVGIADNAIVASKIASGSVGSAALADNAVVAAKIAAAAVGTAAISSGSATSGQVLQANGSGGVSFANAAAGFNGPVSSIDETITRFDGTGGKTVQGSSVVINDSNDVFFPAAIAHSPVSVSLASNTYTLDLSAANYFTGVTAGTRIAPTFVSSASVNFAAATSGVLTLPAGIQANDIVVALIGSDEGSAIANSSNRWSLITRIKGGTGFANGAIFLATITSSAETSIGTFTGLVTSSNGIAYALRNCGGYARIATATGSTGMPDAPSLTPEFTDTVILAIGFLDDDAVLPTAPAGYVNFASQTSASGFTTMVAMNTITAGGAQNPAAFGGSGTDDWASATMEMYGTLGTRSLVLSNPPDREISGYLNAKAHTVVVQYTGVTEGVISWDSKITWASNATPPGSSNALVVLTSYDGVTYRGNYTSY
jgi:hypothetical protein